MRLLVSVSAFALLFAACSHSIEVGDFTTHYEASNFEETATYEQTIDWWKKLDKASPYVSVRQTGATDAGLPLHLVVVSAWKNFSPEKLREKNKTIMLINNGIHPGEPDGIDASMIFMRELLAKPSFEEDFENTVFLFIPIYNVGGALNRNCCSRANQNGPKEYGFRGNARNLDLNRDFIKSDSKNAQTFTSIFNQWNPDVYLETHVSNGSDYQYTMTYLVSHPDKLTPALSEFMKAELIPQMEQRMLAAEEEMIPYVNVHGDSPDSGYSAFYDSPRYSTGFTALHNSIGLLTETHMLKPYKDRVDATLTFLNQLTEFVNENGASIKQTRLMANEQTQKQREFVIDYKQNDQEFELINFKGFEAYLDTSAITSELQLYFDESKPWERNIKYFNRLSATTSLAAPGFYLVPKAYSEVVDRLKLNGVKLITLDQDTLMEVTAYEIESYETIENPFEGHFMHKNLKTKTHYSKRTIRAHEYLLVDLKQSKKRFIIETLEPHGPDSYFNWNFFDEILQQKEWYSSYIFDKEAANMLATDPVLKASFQAMKTDSSFANSKSAQLYWLYKQSDHFEKDKYRMYPVLRVELGNEQ